MISKDQIEQVKEQTDIISVIGNYVELKKTGNTYKGLCPFHNEKTPSFNVNAQSQFYHCFGCGASGNAITFLMEIEGLSFIETLKRLAEESGITLIDNSTPEQRRKAQVIKQGNERLIDLMQKLAQWYVNQSYSTEGIIARNYLKNRKIDEETVRKFSIGYSPDSWNATIKWAQSHGFNRQDLLNAGLIIIPEGKDINHSYDRFRGRLMFPIRNDAGKVVAFSARTLKDENAKYINSPETSIFTKSKVLYGFDLAKNGFRKYKEAILCEGQLDVIACHRAGFTNAIAPQGTAFTDEQAKLLKRFVEKVVVAFDSDGAGQKATDRSFEILLKQGIEMQTVNMPLNSDPDTIFREEGKDALAKVLTEKQNFFDYSVNTFNSTNFNSEVEKAHEAQAIIEKVALIDDAITRSFTIQKLTQMNIPESAIFEQIRKIQSKNQKTVRTPGANFDQPQEFNDQPPVNSQPESKEEKALMTLLDLAIHHGFVAHKLLDQLPDLSYRKTHIGHLLNEVLALTAQGEWKNSGVRLFEKYQGRIAPTIAQTFTVSHYPHLEAEDENGKKVIEKLVDDCVTVLQIYDLEIAEKELWLQYRQTESNDGKREIHKLIMATMKEKQTLKRKITGLKN